MDNQIRQFLNDRHVDVDAGLRVLDGVPNADQVYLRIFRMFAKDQNYEKFMAAAGNGDMTGAERASHSLKGVCGNLGLQGLYRAVLRVNDELKMGRWPDSAAVDLLGDEYALVQEAVAGLENLV